MLEQNYLDNTQIDLCLCSKLLDDKSWDENGEVVVKSIYSVILDAVNRINSPNPITFKKK